MAHFDDIGGSSGADTLRHVDTIATLKATSATDKELRFCDECWTFYIYVESGSEYIPNDMDILQVGTGVSRWVGVAGRFMYIPGPA